MAVPLQKALQIGLQQPKMAEIALTALESCPHEIAFGLAPLVGLSIAPYLTPTVARQFDQQVQPGVQYQQDIITLCPGFAAIQSDKCQSEL